MKWTSDLNLRYKLYCIISIVVISITRYWSSIIYGLSHYQSVISSPMWTRTTVLLNLMILLLPINHSPHRIQFLSKKFLLHSLPCNYRSGHFMNKSSLHMLASNSWKFLSYFSKFYLNIEQAKISGVSTSNLPTNLRDFLSFYTTIFQFRFGRIKVATPYIWSMLMIT